MDGWTVTGMKSKKRHYLELQRIWVCRDPILFKSWRNTSYRRLESMNLLIYLFSKKKEDIATYEHWFLCLFYYQSYQTVTYSSIFIYSILVFIFWTSLFSSMITPIYFVSFFSRSKKDWSFKSSKSLPNCAFIYQAMNLVINQPLSQLKVLWLITDYAIDSEKLDQLLISSHPPTIIDPKFQSSGWELCYCSRYEQM